MKRHLNALRNILRINSLKKKPIIPLRIYGLLSKKYLNVFYQILC